MMILMETCPWGSPATGTGNAKVDILVSKDAQPCWCSIAGHWDALYLQLKTATYQVLFHRHHWKKMMRRTFHRITRRINHSLIFLLVLSPCQKRTDQETKFNFCYFVFIATCSNTRTEKFCTWRKCRRIMGTVCWLFLYLLHFSIRWHARYVIKNYLFVSCALRLC